MIAIVNPQFYGVHGIARYIDSFLSNLPENSPTIYLITGDDLKYEKSYPNVKIIHLPYDTNSRFALFKWSLLARVLIKKMYIAGEIAYVNFHFPPLIPGLFLPREIPIVLTAHTTYLGMSGRFYDIKYQKKYFESEWSAVSIFIKMLMERFIFSKTKHVITLTEQGRQQVALYGFNGPISIIPNGADVTRFSPKQKALKDIDVLFCGRIELVKGSRAMVTLIERLINTKPDIKIAIVGYGGDEVYVNQALKRYSANVLLTGKVPFEQMVDYYQRSKLYASTSYHEGLPGTCLEAMAMELPVAVWDFLFYTPLVEDGITGYLVKPDDYAQMVNRILDLLNSPDLAKKMGEQGRQTLLQEYAWKKLAKDILAVFK